MSLRGRKMSLGEEKCHYGEEKYRYAEENVLTGKKNVFPNRASKAYRPFCSVVTILTELSRAGIKELKRSCTSFSSSAPTYYFRKTVCRTSLFTGQTQLLQVGERRATYLSRQRTLEGGGGDHGHKIVELSLT
jgi:hypothetical protein